MTKDPNFTLSDKYLLREGKIILTGVQALIRIPIDQFFADKAKGLNTATLITGYRGSPLGTLDLAVKQNEALLSRHNIIFRNSLNEDLAATSIWGSQMAGFFPGAKFDGVKGMWYGKAPGVDRSGDALKHANFCGVGINGGVLALGGDDPVSKSSTLPCISEMAFYDAMMPVLYPGSIQEVIDYGRLGFELSRYCGFWIGYKCVTDLMDGFGTAEVSPERVPVTIPGFEFGGQPWQHEPSLMKGPPFNLIYEKVLEDGRMEAAKAFIAANHLNTITFHPANAKAGIVTAGKPYYDLMEAFRLMGLKEEDISRLGIRVLKLGAIFPVEEKIVREFAEGLEKVIVIEEKRDLIENQITRILYHSSYHPPVIGRKDDKGLPFFPGYGESSAELIAEKLAIALASYIPPALKIKVAGAATTTLPEGGKAILPRTPYYCSGCPHNTSTVRVPEGSIAGAGIGCHGMVVLMGFDHTQGLTQMGGEGAQWVGMAPFTETSHFIQNMGDGTFAHSGSLSIRHAIISKVNITFKILFNRAVAMTGGQPVDNAMEVPELTRLLEAEGVRHIIVTSDDIEKYPATAKWADNAERWDRSRILEAQEKLKTIGGVTVLIHDQACAAELRRKRKKGLIETPAQRVFINEEVCEGCNDCSVKSNCLSVVPVETEFGSKNRIDQSSCNLDFSCLKGDCPSFLTVIPAKKKQTGMPKNDPDTHLDLDNIPDPVMRTDTTASIYLMGIGGTGVVTVNQILGTAAMLDGKEVLSLDQIGLSQKGGAVISHFKIIEKGAVGSNRVTTANADAYIGFDLLTAAAEKSLLHASPRKTIAIVSTTKTPAGLQIQHPDLKFPELQEAIDRIEKHTDAKHNIYFDATKISKTLFGSHYQANILLIGAAYQAGTIPIAAGKIEDAIRANGVKADQNILAFRVGRKLALLPEFIDRIQNSGEKGMATPPLSSEARKLISRLSPKGTLHELLEIRVPRLIAYQNTKYAQQYIDFLCKVAQKEQEVMTGSTQLTETVGRYLYKLMAYKDEYEVARLHTQKSSLDKVKDQFGATAKFAIMLHPPILRAMGYHKKIKFGLWSLPFLRLLAKFRFLRGTAFDLFGYTAIRKTERALIEEYKGIITEKLHNLSEANLAQAIDLAALPDMVRGYEAIKMKNVQIYREKLNRY